MLRFGCSILSDPVFFTFINDDIITFFDCFNSEIFTTVLSDCSCHGMITTPWCFSEMLFLSPSQILSLTHVSLVVDLVRDTVDDSHDSTYLTDLVLGVENVP